MTEQELREKIVEIVYKTIVFQETKNLFGANYQVLSENIADALIAAGIGDVNKFADMLASKIPCHSYYYGDSIECAIYALKKGMEIMAEIIDWDRGTDDETPEEYVKYLLQNAEKEFAEERKDD